MFCSEWFSLVCSALSFRYIHVHHQFPEQEILADAKVSVREHGVQMKVPSKEIYSKLTICNFLMIVNSNHGHITYHLRDIFM